MNTLRYFNQIAAFALFLALLMLASCKEREELSFLKIEETTDEPVWDAKSGGDTIVIKFSTNIPSDKITINNAQDWISYQIAKEQLTLYIKKNNEPHTRTGTLNIAGIDKGNILANRLITVKQLSEFLSVESKQLFTYFPKLGYPISTYAVNNSEYKLVIPAEAGEVVSEQLFYTNIAKENLLVSYNYEGDNHTDWVSDLQFIENEQGVAGLRFKVAKLPDGIEQRRVHIKLSDKEYPTLSASVRYSQVRNLIRAANPADVIRTVPAYPVYYSTLLKTDIPIDKLQLKVFNIDHYWSSKLPFEEVFHEEIFQTDLHPSYEESDMAGYYNFRQTEQGIVVEGITSTHSHFPKYRDWSFSDYRLMLCITNEINDAMLCLFIGLENYKEKYLYFENKQKDTTVVLPQEGGDYPLRFRSNIDLHGTTLNIQLSHPEWLITPMEPYDVYPYYKAQYPDINTFRDGDLRALPNPYRSERKSTLKIGFIEEPKEKPGNPEQYEPLFIRFTQKGFTGTYQFEVTLPEQDPVIFDSEETTLPVDITSNLIPEQIKVTKTTPRSGWLRYQFNTDTNTGYVTSVVFVVQENRSGADRHATVEFQGPANEGLSKVVINFTQKM